MRPEEEKDALVYGCLWLIGAVGSIVVVLAALASGCAPRTVVIPADREVVPVYQNGTLDNRKTYIEDEERATGWYVPDATMIELLEAD